MPFFDPQAALLEINSQWDPVFSANVGFPHALKMLDIVWPHIHKFHLDYQVPTLSGEDLYQVVKHRKKHAAPGLDGWRTGEMQLLPQGCFDWFAAFFRRLEDSNEPLPRVLATARQVILNKNGSSEPLQKRLITLLPVILLAYTGARFIHLRSVANAHYAHSASRRHSTKAHGCYTHPTCVFARTHAQPQA